MDSRHDLAISSAFSGRVNTGVPVEIVEAENQSVEAVLTAQSDRQNVSSAEEPMPMDISVDSGPSMDSTRLASSMAIDPTGAGLPGIEGAQISDGMTRVDASQLSTTIGEPQLMSGNHLAGNSIGVDTSQMPVASQGAIRVPDIQSVERQLQQAVSQTTSLRGSFQQIKVNEAVLSSQALEISPESITFSSPHHSGLQESLGSGMSSAGGDHVSHDPLERAKQILGSVSYSDLDISRAINSSIDPNLAVSSSIGAGSGGIDTTTVLNDPDSPPSSPESNFDSSDLLNTSVLQQDEVTARLANAGPIGVAAAAAVMSGRKRKRSHSFESNPALRKRHCSKLVRKLKDTIEELATRVGLQACVVTYRPGKQEPKEDPSFKVFGATPLDTALRTQKDAIIAEMEAVLHEQTPLKRPSLQSKSTGTGPMHDLPALLFEGIPTPVHKMTQAQLRAFIPNMLKFSTGRGKPGWGKDDMKPAWWPTEVPWQNVRSDTRTDDQKKVLSWTEALRRIVICCYVFHGRIDLLPEFSAEHLQHALSPEAAEQLQMHLDRMQQQGELQQPSSSGGNGGGTVISHADEAVTGLGNVATPSQTGDSENQQVFTVDTGMGNCDTSGMPTLVDASLAETAARLQQVADETGKVQYATQTVTVTDRDAKALGQPVGSTTTVLLTAYPGGHSSSGGSGTGPSDSGQFLSQSSAASSAPTASTAPNVQVVYSAAHIDSIPDSIVSSISTTDTTDATSTQGSTVSMANPSISHSSEAYLSLAGQQLMSTASSSGTGGVVEAEQSDLAAELISQYAGTSDFQAGMEATSSAAATSTVTSTDPPNISTSTA